jgi:putative methyltransferase
MQKVKRFPAERIVAEYEWMAKNQIEVLYNCDANYGLFPEDEGLTEALVSCKRKFGFPSKFRAAYAKNSNDRVFRIARALNDAGMSKGVTLGLQSLDETTLEQIKRRNMRINDFASLIKQYSDGKMPTYTELIVALPGETFEFLSKEYHVYLRQDNMMV